MQPDNAADDRDLNWPREESPRWLRFSGLPQLLRPPSRWAVFQALVMFDHQTLRLKGRRRPPKEEAFSLPHEALSTTTGLSTSGVRAALAYLSTTKLLKSYDPGAGRDRKGGRWSTFQVDRRVIKELYCCVAPQIAREHGGVRNARAIHLPKQGMRIYGVQGAEEVLVTYDELTGLATVGRMNIPLDTDKVAALCGLYPPEPGG